MEKKDNFYVGRFAPSPTGPLHFGSIIAALGSYLEALANQGRWLVRIDDLDPPREQAGAVDDILETLSGFGFEWHGEVFYQSNRSAAYEDALAELSNNDLTYICLCSRKTVFEAGLSGPYGTMYPGTCRELNLPSRKRSSIRIRVPDKDISLDDKIQGLYSQNLAQEIGDFVLKRRDGLYSYHLAVALDDAEQGITHIVRGIDLLESTPRQIFLQQQLKLPTPEYTHLPIAVDGNGDKLSKQTYAAPVDVDHATTILFLALQFLGQQPPAELKRETLDTIWQWAKQHWNMQNIPKQKEITVDDNYVTS